MEHFVVSARKYRPQTFEDVIGQQAITNTLENAIKNNSDIPVDLLKTEKILQISLSALKIL